MTLFIYRYRHRYVDIYIYDMDYGDIYDAHSRYSQQFTVIQKKILLIAVIQKYTKHLLYDLRCRA